MIAVVEGNPHRGFGASEQQAFADGIFAHGIHRRVVGQTRRDLLPGFSAVVSAIDVADVDRRCGNG